jgi:hypothetical protein
MGGQLVLVRGNLVVRGARVSDSSIGICTGLRGRLGGDRGFSLGSDLRWWL